MLVACQDFWPLKHALLDYVVHCFMDTADPNFLIETKDDEEEEEIKQGEDQGESDVQTLLNIVDNLNDDFERYLDDSILDHTLDIPTGKTQSMN